MTLTADEHNRTGTIGWLKFVPPHKPRPIVETGMGVDAELDRFSGSVDRSEYARQEAAQLRRRIAELDADMFSLSQADEDYSPAPDWFWNRVRHERPPLAEALGM